MEIEYFQFNINETILVRVKPAGFAEWKAYHDSFMPQKFQYPLSHYEAKADKDGYVRFQTWEFIQTFGPGIDIGHDPPFDTNILIPKDRLKEIEQ